MSEDGDGVRLSEEQRLDWLCLIRSDNVGPRTFRALVNHYGGARAALAALPGLARRGGASRATRIHSRQDGERELKAAQALGVAFVALGEPDYPRRLQMIDDAPPLLAVGGKTAALRLPAVAVVGALWSRDPAHILEPAQTRVSEGAHMAVRLRASRRSQPARSQGETAAAIIHPAICATRRLRRYRRSFNCGKVARDADIKYAGASSQRRIIP